MDELGEIFQLDTKSVKLVLSFFFSSDSFNYVDKSGLSGARALAIYKNNWEMDAAFDGMVGIYVVANIAYQ